MLPRRQASTPEGKPAEVTSLIKSADGHRESEPGDGRLLSARASSIQTIKDPMLFRSSPSVFATPCTPKPTSSFATLWNGKVNDLITSPKSFVNRFSRRPLRRHGRRRRRHLRPGHVPSWAADRAPRAGEHLGDAFAYQHDVGGFAWALHQQQHAVSGAPARASGRGQRQGHRSAHGRHGHRAPEIGISHHHEPLQWMPYWLRSLRPVARELRRHRAIPSHVRGQRSHRCHRHAARGGRRDTHPERRRAREHRRAERLIRSLPHEQLDEIRARRRHAGGCQRLRSRHRVRNDTQAGDQTFTSMVHEVALSNTLSNRAVGQ